MNQNKKLLTKFILLFLYSFLLVYGSLYPISGWHVPDSNIREIMMLEWPDNISRSDLFTNFIVYIPLGFLIVGLLRLKINIPVTVLLATIMGTVFSFLLECLQIYLPNRVPSLFDVLTNGIGTLAGAVFAGILGEQTVVGRKLLFMRRELFLPGCYVNLGLVILGLWALSQLSPFVPSLDLGTLRNGVKPLWYFVREPSQFNLYYAGAYFFNIAGLGLLATTTVKLRQKEMTIFLLFIAVVFLCKIPVISRQISMEALTGFAGGLFLFALLRNLKHPFMILSAAIAILVAFIIKETGFDSSGPERTYMFNWLLFHGQMSNVVGLADILDAIWPFMALAYLTLLTHPSHAFAVAGIGGFILLIFVFALEWAQLAIPGRYPDITDVFLAVLGWLLPWLFLYPNIRANQTGLT